MINDSTIDGVERDLQDFNEWRLIVEEQLKLASEFNGGCSDELVQAIRYSLLAPGKRIRPIMVLLSATACGAQAKTAMPAAIAVEMFHVFTLIHDDLPVMDDDCYRRGQIANHKKFGEAKALLAGNALLAQSFETMLGSFDDAELSRKCCMALCEVARPDAMAGGQCHDLALSSSESITPQCLESIFKRKTGSLLACAAKLGGIVAGSDDSIQNELVQFGENLGIAFQIVDDIRDARSKESSNSTREEVYYVDLVDRKTAIERVEELTATAIDGFKCLKKSKDQFVAFANMALGDYKTT